MTFAEGTTVSVERTRAEIEATLTRYGAESFAYQVSREGAKIGFHAHGRALLFRLPLPDPQALEFTHRSNRRYSPPRAELLPVEEQRRRWEQACRARWRALLLAIKAKLETVEVGISTFEQEFLAYVVLPGRGTVGDVLLPQLDDVYRGKELPPLLGDGRGHRG